MRPMKGPYGQMPKPTQSRSNYDQRFAAAGLGPNGSPVSQGFAGSGAVQNALGQFAGGLGGGLQGTSNMPGFPQGGFGGLQGFGGIGNMQKPPMMRPPVDDSTRINPAGGLQGSPLAPNGQIPTLPGYSPDAYMAPRGNGLGPGDDMPGGRFDGTGMTAEEMFSRWFGGRR